MPYYVIARGSTPPDIPTKPYVPPVKKLHCCAQCKRDYNAERAQAKLALKAWRTLYGAFKAFVTRPDALTALPSPQTHTVVYCATKDERSAWQTREANKAQRIPVPWGHDWEVRSGPLARFPYLSTLTPGNVSYTPSDEFGLLDRKLTTTPGRYLKKFFPEMSERDIKRYIAACKPATFDLATTEDEIERIYRSGPGSCMTHDPSTYASPFHPVRLYGNGPDLALAYTRDETGAILGRCIVWPDRKIYSRIYEANALKITGNPHTRLGQALIAAGYTYGSLTGARLRYSPLPNNPRVIVMPYLDGVAHFVTDVEGDLDHVYLSETGPYYQGQATGGVIVYTPPTRSFPCDHWQADHRSAALDWRIDPGLPPLLHRTLSALHELRR